MGAKAKHDLAPTIRGAFVNALELIENDSGKTFSQLMKEAIEEHGILPVLDRLAKYTVRENAISGKVEHDHKHKHTHVAVSEVNEWLEQFVAGEENSDTTPSLSH